MEKWFSPSEIQKTKNNKFHSPGIATVTYGNARSSGSSHQEALEQAQNSRLKVTIARQN